MPLKNYLSASNETEESQKRISKLVNELRKSPMFQLSLSSKELFHSNFLYWLSQFNLEMFKQVIKQLFENAGDSLHLYEWYEDFKVKREHKHYDLCVTNEDENTVLLVIENKVKSIPNKAQLDSYYSKSKKAQHLLLSLSTDFPESKEIKNKWTIANYQELAYALSEYVKNREGYEYDIIRDYIGYISNFHSLVEEWRVDEKTVSNSFIPKRYELEELRMNDFYTKFYFSQILLQITEKLKKEFEDVKFNWKPIFGTDNKLIPPSKSILYVNSGLTNSNGFLEVKVKIEPDIAILIQIQGEQYRRCVEYYNNDPEYKHASLEKNIDCLRKDICLNRFFALEKSGKLSIPYPQSIGSGNPFRKMKEEYRNGFCKYGNQFIYQYLNIKDRTIYNIITAVVEDVNNFRSIVGNYDAD